MRSTVAQHRLSIHSTGARTWGQHPDKRPVHRARQPGAVGALEHHAELAAGRGKREGIAAVLPPQDGRRGHGAASAAQRLPFDPLLEGAHGVAAVRAGCRGHHVDVDAVRREIGVLANRLGQADQVEAGEVLRRCPENEVFGAGVDEGAVGGVLRGGLHVQVHARLVLDPMPLVAPIDGREPRVCR